VFPSDLPGVNPATLNEMLLYYRLMTKWSGLGDSTKLSRMGLSQAAGGAPELMHVASGEAHAMAGGERDDVLPESTLEVVVRSPEIQDAEPIRSAPMSGAATSSRGGVELLADDLVDPAAVARHLEAMRQAEQWMKVSCRYP
jgi:hypothetical protein